MLGQDETGGRSQEGKVVAMYSPANAGTRLAGQLLESMTFEDKVGQMVMAGFEGRSVTSDLENHLNSLRIGNVIFFARNYAGAEQMWTFTRDLQRLACCRPSPAGFFTAIDQEGGVVARLLSGATVFPGNMALGAADRPAYARRAAAATAQEMLELGLNMNLAPVLDVNNNPGNPAIGVRSYGEDPELVATMGGEAISASQSAGVLATAKHFPGKGDVTVDSHIDLPSVPHSRDRLNAVELVPFKAAIAAGVGAIMTAHVTFPAIEPEPFLPATMSRNVLCGLLRQELGFKGIIITDDLFMGAVSKRYGLGEAAIRAIVAGADIVLMCHDPDEQAIAVKAIWEAARSGRIPKERIESSARRVLGVKALFGILTPPVPAAATAATAGPRSVGSQANRALALRIARESVTVVQDRDGIIPFSLARGVCEVGLDSVDNCKPVDVLVISPDIKNLTMVEDTGPHGSPLAKAVRVFVPGASDMVVSQSPLKEEIAAAATIAAGRDLVIVGTHNAHLHPAQAELVNRVAQAGSPVVVVGMRNPYDLAEFPEVGTFIAAYSFRDCSMRAAVEVIFGSTVPTGRLPVSIRGVKDVSGFYEHH